MHGGLWEVGVVGSRRATVMSATSLGIVALGLGLSGNAWAAPYRGCGSCRSIGAPLAGTAAAKHSIVGASINRMDARGGYRIFIEADRVLRSHKRGWIDIIVTKGRATSQYLAKGLVSKRHVRAKLGDFGRISLRFRPHAATRKTKRSVRRPPSVAPKIQVRECIGISTGRSGSFHGTISFRGEDGYTGVHVRNARGFLWTGTESCSTVTVHREHGTVLDARSSGVDFAAAALDDLPKPWYVASEDLKRDGVRIFRSAGYLASASGFTFDQSLSSAHVAPPKPPFSGSADFASPDQWTGPLSVDFLGEKNVPLAGPGFDVSLKSY